jgi:hypothetical protein
VGRIERIKIENKDLSFTDERLADYINVLLNYKNNKNKKSHNEMNNEELREYMKELKEQKAQKAVKV